MSFQRTSSGLSNEYLFFSVDVIVYVEGGTSRNYDEVLAGNYDPQSTDISFWQRIFQLFSPNKKYKFKSVGSKHTLNQIAEQIIQNNSSTVFVAMDRDFENVKGTQKKNNGIFYTFGYSWENDVWQAEVIKAAFYQLCPICRSEVDPDVHIKPCFDDFDRIMRWVIYADLLLNLHDLKFIEFREKPDSIISPDITGKPQINRARIRSLIKQSKLSKTSRLMAGRKVRLNTKNDCYGHIFDVFGYRLLIYLLKILCQNFPNVPKAIAHGIAIDKFTVEMQNGNLPNLFRHYEKQFAFI